MAAKNTLHPTEFEAVQLTNGLHPRIFVRPIYFELGFSSSPHIYGRNAVLKRLLKAIELLPQEFGFLVWDVYRPRATQAALFEWMRKEIQSKFPHLTEQENFEETKKYVALPAKIGDNYCSPHLSGGAIDLTLFEIASGKELEMGTPFDDCTEKAHRDYFEQLTELTLEEKNIKQRRQLLRAVLEKVGFTTYEYEWWHFDFGNLFWSQIHNCPELFGPLFGDKEWPNSNFE
ncbi:M15 family metallopeptidase [Legionella sp.]|uniref:M15 family metallopeptidase n=1 Tax=Legionella sp. TaxID=459 RepID=UPI003220345F